MNKSYMLTTKELTHQWYVVDAKDVVLGRLATEVASLLRGKHKPTYTPTLDCGDYVIVINADKVAFTGAKLEKKMYYRHSGYNHGIKSRTAQEMLDKQPQKIVEFAVKGMLPHTKLGDQMYTKLFVYCDGNHPHQAQKPEVYNLKG